MTTKISISLNIQTTKISISLNIQQNIDFTQGVLGSNIDDFMLTRD